MNERFIRALPPLIALSIVAGAIAHLMGAPAVGDAVWALALVAVLVPLTVGVARSLRAGDVGVDAIALLAIAAALALGSSSPARSSRSCSAEATRSKRRRPGGRVAS